MENQKKLIVRAQLIADGIARNHKWSLLTPAEIGEALEILAEELAKIEHDEESSKIRAIIEAHGMQFPQINNPVQSEGMSRQEITENIIDSEDLGLCGMLTKAYIQAPTVHHGPAVQQQTQRNDNIAQSRGVCSATKNLDTQNCEEAPMHPGTPRECEIQLNPNDSRKEICAAGITKDVRRNDSCSALAPLGGTGSWTWRNWSYNRVPPAIEDAVREKSKQGWSKSKLAREFRLNRRTIIRICNSNAGTAQIV